MIEKRLEPLPVDEHWSSEPHPLEALTPSVLLAILERLARSSYEESLLMHKADQSERSKAQADSRMPTLESSQNYVAKKAAWDSWSELVADFGDDPEGSRNQVLFYCDPMLSTLIDSFINFIPIDEERGERVIRAWAEETLLPTAVMETEGIPWDDQCGDFKSSLEAMISLIEEPFAYMYSYKLIRQVAGSLDSEKVWGARRRYMAW